MLFIDRNRKEKERVCAICTTNSPIPVSTKCLILDNQEHLTCQIKILPYAFIKHTLIAYLPTTAKNASHHQIRTKTLSLMTFRARIHNAFIPAVPPPGPNL